MKYILIIFSLLAINKAHSQIGIGIKNPHPSSVLEINSSDKGILIPRLTTSDRNKINNPTNGLIIYNLINGQLEIYRDSSWGSVFSGYENSGLLFIQNGRVQTLPNGNVGQYLRISKNGTLEWHGASIPINVKNSVNQIATEFVKIFTSIDSNGGSNIINYGVNLSSELDSVLSKKSKHIYYHDKKQDTLTIQGLLSNKKYFYKTFFSNNLGITHSKIDSFTTLDYPLLSHSGKRDTNGLYITHSITFSQTITVLNGGESEVLLIGGGQGSNGIYGGQGGGAVYIPSYKLTNRNYSITIGNSDQDSEFDSLFTAIRGGNIQTNLTGISSTYGYNGANGGYGTSSFSANGQTGGNGNLFPLPNVNTYYQGGGGGGTRAGTPGSGGLGGGGNGNSRSSSAGNNNAQPNTGGGAGGVGYYPGNSGGSGGSGILIIKHKYK